MHPVTNDVSRFTQFKAHLQTKGSLCLFENLKSPKAINGNKAWKKFYENLTNQLITEDKDTLLVGPYTLDPNKPTRANNHVASVSALVFDIDHAQGKSFEEITNLIPPVAGVIHTTHSHQNDDPRYRVILPLTTPVPASQFIELRTNFLFFNPELAQIVDPACSDISRAYFLFSSPESRAEEAQCCVLVGNVLNPAHYFNPSGVVQQGDSMGIFKHQMPMEDLTQGGFGEGQRHTNMIRYIGRLINTKIAKEDVLLQTLAWNNTLKPPLAGDEVDRAVNGIWKKHLAGNPDWLMQIEQATHTNLVAPSAALALNPFSELKTYPIISAGDFIHTAPPPRQYVIDGFLPKRIVAGMIAAGGSGKSYTALHIAISVASGSALFGRFIPTKPLPVVYVTGEDDVEEMHRRISRITANLPASIKKAISSNFNVIDFADAFELFTVKPPHGETQITLVPERICKSISERFNEVGLVIIDPISRFRGGDENIAADTTRFVQALQQVRDRLNTAVLCIHHANKGAKANGISQNNARGSSALIDGLRLVFELNVLSPEETKKQYGVTDIPLQIVTLNCVKTNYGKAPDPLILKRKDDGSLEPFGMQAGDYLRHALLQEISIAGLSKSQFKETYGGVDGKFGLSEKALVRKIDEYVADGLVTIPVRSPMTLTNKGQETLNLSGLSGQHPGK